VFVLNLKLTINITGTVCCDYTDCDLWSRKVANTYTGGWVGLSITSIMSLCVHTKHFSQKKYLHNIKYTVFRKKWDR